MRTRLSSLALVLAATLILAPAAGADTFTVDTGSASPDTNPGDGTCATAVPNCSLRAAIEESNARVTGAPHTIQFSAGGSSIQVFTTLPGITRNGTFIDGCNVGRTQLGTPAAPSGARCVDLIGMGAPTGLQVGDTTSTTTTGVTIEGLALTGFASGQAIHVWGADSTLIAGNQFGLRKDGTTVGPNGASVSVTGRTQDGSVVDRARGNLIGGPSSATDDPASCGGNCNVIVNSLDAGIDLVGTPSTSGAADAPAGGTGGALEGTTIAGNWIGVRDAAGTAAANGTAVRIGDAHDTMVGGADPSDGNIIAGNTHGVDQGSGSTAVTLRYGVFGISPDGKSTVGNGDWNARLHGGGFGENPFVEFVKFGPAAVGLQIDGTHANLLGSFFYSPDSARFTTAAVRVGPGGDHAFIGTNSGVTPFGCMLPLVDSCNTIGDTAPGAPGVWIDGADDARIWRNAIGAGLAPPLDGPAIRIDGGAVGAVVGDPDGDDANIRNLLIRQSAAGIEIGGGATKIVVGDNEGMAIAGIGPPPGIFTDLLPDPGPGNSGPANNNIQAPEITQASRDGVGGTAIPGATIRVLQQQRAPDSDTLPSEPGEGYVFPTAPSTVIADEHGIWGIAFPTASRLKSGQGLLASQTTADGSSEYAGLQPAAEGSPPVLVTFTSGPSGVIGERTATFTFIANRVVRNFECSFDAGAFVPCSSPYTLNGLDIGGHQLQVRGVDPTGVAGNRASRTWIVLLPEPPAPGPPVSAAGAVRFSSLVSLPSAKSCISKRSMRITVHTPKGSKVKGVVIRIAGRKVGSAKSARTIPISLKGLKRGRFVVKVEVTLADGRVIKGSRTYKTCAKKAAKKKKKKKKSKR